MKLYDIPPQIEDFERRLIEGGGELTPELEKEWSDFIAGSKDRLEAAGFVIMRLENDADTCAAEIKRLQDRRNSTENNAKRLKDLTLYALKALGGKLKTSLVSMWTGRTGKQITLQPKEGTDLVELHKTHPELVRVKHEVNMENAKNAYGPLIEADVQEREAASLVDTPTEVISWEERLKRAGLPDVFNVSISAGTEYLRIK